MSDRLIVIDGYNLIHRTPQLRPGPDRNLREAREKLVNLLSWALGGDRVRYLVVFDGAEGGGRDEGSGRVEIRWSRPPDKADDVIRRLVEDQVGRVDRLTVVTADLEVARHARAMGADIALSDLFLAAALGAGAQAGEQDEKPELPGRAELEQWAKIFREQRASQDDEE